MASVMVRYNLINSLEELTVLLLDGLVRSGKAHFEVDRSVKRREQNSFLDQLFEVNTCTVRGGRQIVYNECHSQQHFTLVLYILTEVHSCLLVGIKCTQRELYYKDPTKIRSTMGIRAAVRDVCGLLRTAPWELGIQTSSKGIIAGTVRFYMKSGDVITCYSSNRGTLLPGDFMAIDWVKTSATFALLVEKDTIFFKLMQHGIFETIGTDIILITGKGFPDLATRFVVNHIANKCDVPVFALFDADPFGIEILATYQYGSKCAETRYGIPVLNCPQIRWIGIHPSELDMICIPTVALNNYDIRKILNLFQRDQISSSVQCELKVLINLVQKTDIDGLSDLSLNFLVNDYIPNKIKRNLKI